MNLFEKIAKENKDNSTLVNVGLGATTLGGLGAAGYYHKQINSHNSDYGLTNNQHKRLYKTYSQSAQRNKQLFEQLEKNKIKDAEEEALKMLRVFYPDSDDEVLKNTDEYKRSFNEELKDIEDKIEAHKSWYKNAINNANVYKAELDKRERIINNLNKNKKLGLAAAGLGATGLAYNYFKNN